MTVRVEMAKNRILVDGDQHIAGLNVSIPGAYFREREEVWSVPLDLSSCHLLREKFGNRLKIGPALTAWARAEIARVEQAKATSSSYDADLDRLPEVAPRLFKAMDTRTYQRSGVRFIVDTSGRDGRMRALLADTVGLGKSAQAIGAILEAGVPGPFLIVCPKTAVLSTWDKEIRKWLPGDEVVTLPEGKAKRDRVLEDLVKRSEFWLASDPKPGHLLRRTWVVIHPEATRTQTWWICQERETDVAGTTAACGFKTKYTTKPTPVLDCGHEKNRSRTEHEHAFPQLFQIQWGAILADESHSCLIKLSGTPNLRRRGMELLRDLVPPKGLRLAISGTPFRSKPHQLWSTLNWLDPKRWSSKWTFIQRYWETGGYTGYELVEDGYREEREHLLLAELDDIMIRRTRQEVRGDLPAKDYPSNVGEGDGLTSGIYLPMTRNQERAYRQMEKEGEVNFSSGQLQAVGILAELTRLRQFASAEWDLVGGQLKPKAAGNKYEWLVQFLTDIGLPDRPSTKVVIVSQFTQILNAFKDGIEKDLGLRKGARRCGMVTGEVTGVRRQSEIERFEDPDDPLDVLFLNTLAGGTSITLDAADVMVILDETYVDDDQEQVEGRIDNRNPERKICPRSYYYLRSAGTMEEFIAAANAEAKARGLKILDARQIASRAKEFVNR